MPKKANQKVRMLKLLEIMTQETDEAHPMTEARLRERLLDNGYEAERKTVLADLHALEDYGLDIVHHRGRGGGFFLGTREFELAELKMLVDAVQASKFISEKRSRQLIRKLCGQTSRHGAGKLARQVYVSGRVKHESSAILYAVDTIHTAIAEKCKVCFRYGEWTIDKVLKPRHNGKLYTVSPYMLMWEEGYYYLVGYDEEASLAKHFRVDKVMEISLLEEPRTGVELFRDFDPALYARETFGMYGGKETLVTLECDATLIGVVLDRFGDSVTVQNRTKDTFRITVRVRVSPVFLGWVIGYGSRMRIVAPENVLNELRALAQDALKNNE